jgi:transposase
MKGLPFPENPCVYMAVQPIDFRLGINGLCGLVRQRMHADVVDAALYLFTNRRRNRLKVLYWHRNGFCLWLKQLEADRFYWPKIPAASDANATLTLTLQQLEWLLEGIDISKIQPHPARHYRIQA